MYERRERGRRERKEDSGEKREAAIRMKITRGECAGDRNEGRVRWGSIKLNVQDQNGRGSKRKSCTDKSRTVWKSVSERQ